MKGSLRSLAGSRVCEMPDSLNRPLAVPNICFITGARRSSNHPFFDGNKRAALLAVGVFLARNGRTLTASEAEATVVMMRVAKGGMTEAEFAGWLKSNNARRRRS